MIELLIANPLLLLFLVAAIGYPLGHVKIGGVSLGVAAVLFVGLAIGSLDQNLKLPEIVQQLGLAIFVYTIGLSSGRGFVASLRRKGLGDNLLLLGTLLFAFGLTAALMFALGIKPSVMAGLFAGALTNTPALAAAIEYLKLTVPAPALEQIVNDPVIGYSVAYPMGVVGAVLSIALMQRLFKTDYAAEAHKLREYGATSQNLVNQTVRITRPEVAGKRVQDLSRNRQWRVIFSRMQRGEELNLVTGDTRLELNDLVSIVGAEEDVAVVITTLGERDDTRLELDRRRLDFRRVFVSNPNVVGRRLSDLNLPQTHGAIVTRLRRGDMDLLPHADTVLELGDRVRVVALREKMDDASEFFGDSYRALSEIDILTFSLGLALGLLLGALTIPLPGGGVFKLGNAGGPLIVALVLGFAERTGPLIWNMPYSANLTLRQFGLVLFLAGVGTRSGFTFSQTLMQGGGATLFFAGVLLTCCTALGMLFVGHKLLKVPMSLLIGMVAALQTQPAVLGFALEQTENDLPNIGYATVYPLAMITKIILAQVILILFLGG